MQHRQKKRKFVKKIFALVDPPPTILRPANVSVLPGYDVTLTCLARSTVEHNMTWYRARDYDGLRNDSRVAFLRNGSLSIRYVCAARAPVTTACPHSPPPKIYKTLCRPLQEKNMDISDT